VLKRGGNAIDAAVAVGYALAVVYPARAISAVADSRRCSSPTVRKTFADFREVAPFAATANMYLDANGNVGAGSEHPRAAGRCGAGNRVGSRIPAREVRHAARAQLIAPAIKLASEGFVLDQGDVDILSEGTTTSARIRPAPPSISWAASRSKPVQNWPRKTWRAPLTRISRAGTAGFLPG